jgi:hypothetical protein
MDETNAEPGKRCLPRGILGLLFLAPALMACGGSTAPILTFWEAALTPIRPSFVGGRVVAVTQHGRTDAGINIQDAEPEIPYGWRIDSGTCDGTGGIQGGPGLYPPLLPGRSGTASAETSLSELFKSGRQFAARVFRTGEGGAEQIVACGDLEETT